MPAERKRKMLLQYCYVVYGICISFIEIVRNLFQMKPIGAHYFLVYLFQLLYMFRAIMCPSSGQLTAAADQTATHTEQKLLVSHRYSKFSW